MAVASSQELSVWFSELCLTGTWCSLLGWLVAKLQLASCSCPTVLGLQTPVNTPGTYVGVED